MKKLEYRDQCGLPDAIKEELKLLQRTIVQRKKHAAHLITEKGYLTFVGAETELSVYISNIIDKDEDEKSRTYDFNQPNEVDDCIKHVIKFIEKNKVRVYM